MIVISSSLVLEATGTLGANNPVIGYENLTRITNVTATSANSSYPVTNVANPATNLVWLSASTSTQYVTITHNRVDPIDYVAIAEHNLGSTGATISVETLNAGVWTEVVSPAILPEDRPAIFRFSPLSCVGVRLKIVPNGAYPTIAVVHVGKLLVLPRPIYVGHTPITFGRETQTTNARSESGKFLGRIVLRKAKSTSVALTQLPRSWYRANMEPFAKASEENTFFFAWRPSEFPYETGYTWLTQDPRPVNSTPEGFVDVELSLGGIA